MDGIKFILLALLILGIIIGIPSLLIFFLYKWLTKKGFRWIGNLVVVSLISLLAYSIYTAFYPTDSFYFDDFKQVTSRKIPGSASVIDKTASYPDFHGKYVSCSLIKLSKQDYVNLLGELNSDKNIFKNAEAIYSEEFNEIMENKSVHDIKFSFARKVNNGPDNLSYIGFFNDQETIVVWYFHI
jgi:hypothetical protein